MFKRLKALIDKFLPEDRQDELKEKLKQEALKAAKAAIEKELNKKKRTQ